LDNGKNLTDEDLRLRRVKRMAKEGGGLSDDSSEDESGGAGSGEGGDSRNPFADDDDEGEDEEDGGGGKVELEEIGEIGRGAKRRASIGSEKPHTLVLSYKARLVHIYSNRFHPLS